MMVVYVCTALLTAVAGQGYQAVTDASDPVVVQHHEVVSFVVRYSNHAVGTVLCDDTPLQGKLGGVGSDRDLPTVAIVTHYDTFGLAPVSSSCVPTIAVCHCVCIY